MANEHLMDVLDKLEQEGFTSLSSMNVYLTASQFIKDYDVKTDIPILDRFCRYLDWSLHQDKPENSYVSCGFKKEHVIAWIEHIKAITVKCLISMAALKPDLQTDSKSLSVFLSVIVNLSTIRNWRLIKLEEYRILENGFTNLTNNIVVHMLKEGEFYENVNIVLQSAYTRPEKISLTKTNLHAIASLATRPVLESQFYSTEIMLSYIRNVFYMPGFVYYVRSLCPDSIPESLFPVIVDFLYEKDGFDCCMKNKDICFLVSLLANLCDFGQYSSDLNTILFPKYIDVLLKLSKRCESELSTSKKSHWYHVLGWISAPIHITYANTVQVVKWQLETLWKPVYIKALFEPLFVHVEARTVQSEEGSSRLQSSPKNSAWKSNVAKFFRKVLPGDSKRRNSVSAAGASFATHTTQQICLVCSLYNKIIASLTSTRIDILTALCFKESSSLLISLWVFLEALKSDLDIKAWVDVLVTPVKPEESLILLFCELLTHFVTVLDDQELYEEEKVIKLSALSEIGHFINNLCYRLLCHPQYSKVRAGTWTVLKTLLTVLHRRDSRRKFCRDGLWLIDSGRMCTLITDMDKGRQHGAAKRALMEMPHVIKEEARVVFFRKWAASEKGHCAFHGLDDTGPIGHTCTGGSSGSPSTQTVSSVITIRRGRIVEDGYAQLTNLSPRRLKGTIRVRFQNELGLDEAGIDQDGVFKEFLEETINLVFSPTLNLFKATSENLLYPSPLSYLHEDHLALFEFVGKMLGKAVFEGIVVDVHFAPFFVTQMLGLQQNGVLFSVIDELQSLDREIYNSLIYIKHYQGDIRNLDLTFSVDQDVLGEIRTFELIPGGRSIPVTNENKISYIYHKAHFHLYAQIKEPSMAFLKGFRYLIPSDMLRIFSPPELQRLISGEDSDIDLLDLRRNTQYYGGFHDSHRVIVWLWDILERDFNEEERRLFLKFVTSCSKPPLLGFANLDPAFSVRCVEVSDDDDTGDTIGSVLRGFLTLGRQEPTGRLPTSSTCFNLLKLPNYHKKTTLRDKLRYAISSNVGFELS